MSGISAAVGEMSGTLLKVNECRGKNLVPEKWRKTVAFLPAKLTITLHCV